jgi:hypothetical protein
MPLEKDDAIPLEKITLSTVKTPKPNASVMNIKGGPYNAPGADTECRCGSCGDVVARLPSNVQLMGPVEVILVCYSCGANNLAPGSTH